ncbi:hypothetical protein [Thalassomonas actiniarum]|uniref:Serine protease n=1 Tax=Thalassomonas actiniarum TaxID=485447 RepID=A0AAE9YWZ7_9GAMM|nr:hypothetical protein [Thalassomonas actiniarum]WDE02092.1 hypothetical protein SG35_030480 [Thalassomonas actiniarum]
MASQILVKRDDDSNIHDKGSVTAIVRILGSKNEDKGYYLMSCLHVLGLTFHNFPHYDKHTNIFFADDPETKVATYDGCIRGNLYFEKQGLPSFDAALAKIDFSGMNDAEKKAHIEELKKKTGAPKLNDYIYYPENTPKSGWVMTPRGAKKASGFNVFRGIDKAVVYDQYQGHKNRAFHRVMIEYDTNTRAGDSGSPVVDDSKKVLLGMHIAGSKGKGYMIPAIDLIDQPTLFAGSDFDKQSTIIFA